MCLFTSFLIKSHFSPLKKLIRHLVFILDLQSLFLNKSDKSLQVHPITIAFRGLCVVQERSILFLRVVGRSTVGHCQQLMLYSCTRKRPLPRLLPDSASQV